MIGRTISHYRIIEKLGEGGMGVVYRAHDESLDRDVALKVLPEEVAQHPERLARFEREAKTVAALNHPNIVTIHSVEEVDGVHFITMEMVEGQTLSEVLTPSGFPLDRLFDLAIPLADAVNSAHSKGVAHRDLKPANIMIDHEGRLKILDFGLAKLFDPTMEQSIPADGRTLDLPSSPTVEGKILGTPDYMSPEQAEGKQVDHRSDIFSLGIILYEMATGHRPFRGDSPAGTISSILRDTPVSITDLRSELPNHLGRIVGRCLDKRPDRRYQSALDLRNDLVGLKRETRSPHRGEIGEPVPGPGRQRIAVIAVVAVAVMALVFWQLRPGDKTPGAGIDPQRKMLVVLPFETLGPSEDEYFADGITEEITAKVAGVKDLGVIARTSAMKYKNTEKTVREIGEELGVGYVLEGTVRWQKLPNGQRQVRVTPQLIGVTDETQMWADSYLEDIEGIFQVQAVIAEQVVMALGVTLREPERRTMESRPTRSIRAHQFYLRGLDSWRHPSFEFGKLHLAVQMFEKAVELDPEFAQAQCYLSQTHSALFHFFYDRTPERLALAKEAADRGFAAQPDLAEVHLALGWYYYWGFRDYDRALAEFSSAANNLPNSANCFMGMAAIMRRQGKWDDAITNFQRACEMSPQDASQFLEAGNSLYYARRYEEAEYYFDRSILLAPDQVESYVEKALVQWMGTGDIDRARATLRDIPDDKALVDRRYVMVDLLGRDYPSVLERVKAWPQELIEYPYFVIPKSLYMGLIYRFMGEADLATAAFDSARIVLEGMAPDHQAN